MRSVPSLITAAEDVGETVGSATGLSRGTVVEGVLVVA